MQGKEAVSRTLFVRSSPCGSNVEDVDFAPGHLPNMIKYLRRLGPGGG